MCEHKYDLWTHTSDVKQHDKLPMSVVGKPHTAHSCWPVNTRIWGEPTGWASHVGSEVTSTTLQRPIMICEHTHVWWTNRVSLQRKYPVVTNPTRQRPMTTCKDEYLRWTHTVSLPFGKQRTPTKHGTIMICEHVDPRWITQWVFPVDNDEPPHNTDPSWSVNT